MSRLLKFVKLPTAEKILFIETFLFVPAVRIALWLIPFAVLQRGFSKFLASEAETSEPDWSQIKKIVRAVRFVSRFIPFASCLTQAVAALLLVKLNGQEAELKLGVAKNNNADFEAHAWLEKNGQIIIGKVPRHGRFIVLNFYQGQIL